MANWQYFRTGEISSLDALDTAVHGTSTPGEHDAMLLAALQFQAKVTELIRKAILIQQSDHKQS